MEDSHYYFTNLNLNDLNEIYTEPTNFLKSVYQKNGGPSSIKINLVDFKVENKDPIHLDPGDMAY
jgi:hypothetical protein